MERMAALQAGTVFMVVWLPLVIFGSLCRIILVHPYEVHLENWRTWLVMQLVGRNWARKWRSVGRALFFFEGARFEALLLCARSSLRALLVVLERVDMLRGSPTSNESPLDRMEVV